MKHTLAVAALLGHAHALAAYTDAKDQDAGWNAKVATGQDGAKCPLVMRGQKDKVWHYTSQTIYKVAKTTKTIAAGTAKELACKEGPTVTKGQCTTGFTDATPPVINALYAVIVSTVALSGNRVNGAFACPQEIDRCPGAKVETIAKDASAAVTRTMTIKDAWAGCAYLFETTCSAPYVALDTKATGYASANYAGLVFAVVEYDNWSSAKFWSSAEVTGANRKFSAAVTDFDSLTDATLQKVPKEGTTWAANANDGKNQGRLGRKMRWYKNADSKADQADDLVDAAALNLLWAAKRTEYAKFATDKAAYETKRTAYNTALTAAEKLTKDTLDKDIFAKLAPTEEQKKTLNVPVRPNNPTAPSLYSGPTLSAKADEYKKGTLWQDALLQETQAADHLFLGPGKSFGTMGSGSSTGVAATATTLNEDSIALGEVFQTYSAGTTCVANYMMFQAGFVKSDTSALDGSTNKQELKAGVKTAKVAWYDSLGTTPAAAADPQTPATGASMLAAGAATVAVAMTLF